MVADAADRTAGLLAFLAGEVFAHYGPPHSQLDREIGNDIIPSMLCIPPRPP